MEKLNEKLVAWYNLHIVKGWYKTWTVWAAAAALLLPDLLQLLLENADLVFSSLAPMEDETKARLRLVMIAVIPVLRSLKQKSLPKPLDTIQP